MAEAVLIGLLVGIERESDREERHAGLRDFVTIGLAGGLCGLLQIHLLTVAVLLSIVALVGLFRWQTPGRTGITTEIAAVATFLLCVLTTTPSLEWGSSLAIALTVVLVLFLDTRDALNRFFRETITEREFHDTLRFLAVVFVILPVLPAQDYGPYGFFSPRRVWMFVILVCSISWLGYFLQKFLGEGRGLALTGVLGGIASTTAATVSLARQSRESGAVTAGYTRAALLANAVQCPRILAVLLVISPALAWASTPVLAAMMLAGFGAAWTLGRAHSGDSAGGLALQNPFRLGPALKFGALFALVRLVARALTAQHGDAGVYVASAVGGSVDVDAIVFSVAGLVRDGQLEMEAAVAAVLLAWAANAVFKTAVAYWAGARGFAHRVAAGFVIMLGAALLAFAWGD
jgi:uncharacterized membrane protein (DUF4010 family)